MQKIYIQSHSQTGQGTAHGLGPRSDHYSLVRSVFKAWYPRNQIKKTEKSVILDDTNKHKNNYLYLTPISGWFVAGFGFRSSCATLSALHGQHWKWQIYGYWWPEWERVIFCRNFYFWFKLKNLAPRTWFEIWSKVPFLLNSCSSGTCLIWESSDIYIC